MLLYGPLKPLLRKLFPATRIDPHYPLGLIVVQLFCRSDLIVSIPIPAFGRPLGLFSFIVSIVTFFIHHKLQVS